MRDLLSEKCTKPGLWHKILCRSPFVQFSQLQKPKFVKVLLYTNEKDKITTKGKKVQQKPCKGRQTYLLHSLCIFDRLLLTG